MGSNQKEYRFHEGCLEHKWKSSYRQLWMVMKKNVIYIFRDRPYIPENHEGTLTIDQHTEFEEGEEKPKNYKFTLYTSNRRRVNTFKSQKKSERDLWRGYIVGVSKQKVPDDLDLPRDIINRIKQDVANYHLDSPVKEEFDVVSRRSGGNTSVASSMSSPRQSIASSRSNPNRMSVASGDSGVSAMSISPSAGSGSMTIEGCGGGPFMRHKFSNKSDDSFVPSWFFEACTREKAESYLAIAAEKRFGDTLMRESTKFKQDGSYVISKRIVKQGKSSIEHYEVIRVDRGYKIKVENPHDAMRNLTDVMEYFVRTSGTYATVPLTTNRPSDFGMAEDPYNTGRIQLADTVADVLSEPAPDYEEPVPLRPLPRQPYQTVTPNSSTFNFHQARLSYNTERHAKDYKQRPGKPSLDDIQTNIKAAATLHMFDQTIEGFDERAREEDYINLKDLLRTDEDSLPSPPPTEHLAIPPLPKPHKLKAPAYVNEEPPQLPPARQERAKSMPNFPEQLKSGPSLAEQLRSAQLNPVLEKKAVINAPPPSVKHSHSEPVMKNVIRDGVPTPQQLGLKKTNFQKPDPSVGEIMRPSGHPKVGKSKSLDVSSVNIPTPQQMGLRPTSIIKTEPISEPRDNKPEIDQSHPGGVSDLASKFERSSSEDTPSHQHKGGGPVTNPAPAMCPNSNSSDHLYCNDNKEDPYNDAITPKHQNNGIMPKSPAAYARARSKSTPTISREDLEHLKVFKFSPEKAAFIQQLETVVGGQQQRTKGIPRPGATSHDDDVYEELPDDIA